MVVTVSLSVSTEGQCDLKEITREVGEAIEASGMTGGIVTVFVPGATGGVTTIEFEPGALRDLEEALERIAPSTREYHHDRRWGDGNGFSHLRAALLGPSLGVPVLDGKPLLGTWQQIVLVECDVRSRRRTVVLSFVGSSIEDRS